MINLQSSQVKRNPQNTINEFIIRKLSPLAVGVDISRNMPEHPGTGKIKVIFMKKKINLKNDNNNIVFVKINNNKIT